jgi:hypothetical protein
MPTRQDASQRTYRMGAPDTWRVGVIVRIKARLDPKPPRRQNLRRRLRAIPCATKPPKYAFFAARQIPQPTMSRQTLTDQAGSVTPASRFPRDGRVLGPSGVAAVGLHSHARKRTLHRICIYWNENPRSKTLVCSSPPLPGSRRPKLPPSNAGHSSRPRPRSRLTTDQRFD